MTAVKNTQKLYDNQAEDWKRTEPTMLSDYSARPFVLDLCGSFEGLSVLDIGCGEGYVSREIVKRGAKNVLGIDISEKMIERAISEKNNQGINNIEYQVQNVTDLDTKPHSNYDLVIAMFLLNYLDLTEMHNVLEKSFKVLNVGGNLVFSVPHPSLAFIKESKFPFYFEKKGGYFSGRNILFPGKIWRRDGISVNVQCIHKTVEDYFECLKKAGFTLMPEVYELRVTEEHIQFDPEFFEPLRDLPLHMAFKVKKQ